MQFKIKDQEYFLSFVEEERRWYLFTAAADGLRRIPVYVDAPKYERFSFTEKDGRNIPN